MILIIDGYNLLKSIFPGKNDRLDKQREQLIRQLGYYKAKRDKTITSIVIVFDGGVFPHPQREVHSGIVVMFAGFKSNADRWIKGYVERNKHKELLVVSNDREVVKDALNAGQDTIKVGPFYSRLQDALLQTDEQTAPTVPTQQFEEEHVFQGEELFENVDRQGLNLLMEQASLQDVEKLEEERVAQREHAEQKVSKKEKQRLRKLKKL